jgi:hypothetical protein
MEQIVLKIVQTVIIKTIPTKHVKYAQKIVQLALDQLMINVLVVNQNGTYMKVNVSNHAQKAIMEIIDNVIHAILTVIPVTVPLILNVIHALRDSSLQMTDTLVLELVKTDSTETQIPELVMYVKEHVAHVMDPNQGNRDRYHSEYGMDDIIYYFHNSLLGMVRYINLHVSTILIHN